MSDKKEVTELCIKVSVDTTELDKLEAQLRRISGLMVNVGLKKPASGGFVIHCTNIDKEVVQNAVCKATNRESSKIMWRVGGMAYMRDGSVLLGSEGYIGKSDSDAAMAFKLESLNQGLKRLADNTQKNQKQMEELTRVFNDTNAAIAEQIRRISIDALRNNSGFA